MDSKTQCPKLDILGFPLTKKHWLIDESSSAIESMCPKLSELPADTVQADGNELSVKHQRP
jgi:hypothetical protein